MLKKYQDLTHELDTLAEKTVDAVFHVHKNLGAGYPERIYEAAQFVQDSPQPEEFELWTDVLVETE